MKFLLIPFIVVLVVLTAPAQNSIKFKVYQNTDYFELTANHRWPQGPVTDRVFNYTRVSFAVAFREGKKYYHQVEVFFPQFSRPTEIPGYPLNTTYYSEPYKVQSSAFSFRYELLRRLSSDSKRLHSSLGIGLNPYYQKTENISTDPSFSNKFLENTGAAVNVIAGFEVMVSPKFSLEVSLPLKLYDFRVSRFRLSNPALPIRAQQKTVRDHLFFEDAYTLRAGLAYKLK